MTSRRSALIGTTILIIVVIVGGYVLIWGLSAELKTPYPVEWVETGSMEPVLQPGDLILVKGIQPNKIQLGDIIVFHQPGDYNNLIIHRVVNITNEDGQIYLTTKGDANPASISWEVNFPASDVIGMWTGFRIPYAGWVIDILKLPLFGGLTIGDTVSISLIVILLALDYVYPDQDKKESQEEKGTEPLKKS